MGIGLGEESDDFLTVLRYAMPEDGGGDGARSTAWREHLPLVVLRIRDTRPAHQPQPYPPVAFETRSGTTPPETALAPDLVTLAEAVCSRWGQPCDRHWLLNMKASRLKLTGPECVKVGMNCLAPNEDAAYLRRRHHETARAALDHDARQGLKQPGLHEHHEGVREVQAGRQRAREQLDDGTTRWRL